MVVRSRKIEVWLLATAGLVSIVYCFAAITHFMAREDAQLLPPSPVVKQPSKLVVQPSSVTLAQRAAGEVFRDCAQCPEMVVLPAGKFDMGSPSGEAGRSRDEGPVHPVQVPRVLAVSRYEITFEDWDTCIADGGCSHRPDDRSWGRGKRPAINVSWGDAKQYVNWLAAATSKHYRLLTEAEWEYAARAGSTSRYPWGEDVGKDVAALRDAVSRSSFYQSSPVGAFPQNRFGLHDMIGNVWEWTEDCWNESYAGAPGDGRPWLSGDCGQRVVRGSSWLTAARDARAAVRFGFVASTRMSDVGFRIAQSD